MQCIEVPQIQTQDQTHVRPTYFDFFFLFVVSKKPAN